jgi:alkaline phosphatase
LYNKEKQGAHAEIMAIRLKGILGRCAAALAVLWCFAACAAHAAPARNIILFIGDGMQLAHETAASNYLYGEDSALVWHAFPYRNFVTTWNIDAYDTYAAAQGGAAYAPDNFDPILGYDPGKGGDKPYPLSSDSKSIFEYFFPGSHPSSPANLRSGPATDSAAAATAMATGEKVRKARLSWRQTTENGEALVTISELIRSRNGASIGIVSTVPFSHATPAAFASHNINRNNFYTGRQDFEGLGIADEILTVIMPDVVIGGGHPAWDNPGFNTSTGFISQELYDNAKKSEAYYFVERTPGMDGARLLAEGAGAAAQSGKKLFALFGGKGGNFEPPVPANAPGSPRIDRATQENPLLGHAITATLQVLSGNPRGFFVLAEQGDIDWANHANNFSAMIGTVWDLDQAVRAAISFVDRPGDSVDWDNTLLIVTADHANSFMRLNPGKRLGPGQLPEQECDGKTCRYPDGTVKYYTGGHTNELVSIYAMGAGLELFAKYEGAWYPGTRLLDNTHIFAVMQDAAIGDQQQ